MAHNTKLSNRSTHVSDDDELGKEKAIVADDYSKSMFLEGHNRTANKGNVKSDRGYDRAAHNIADQAMDKTSTTAAMPLNTFRSRDGTDAAGAYDEDGGSLGGTEKELDDLEASGTPVDKNPHMKD